MNQSIKSIVQTTKSVQLVFESIRDKQTLIFIYIDVIIMNEHLQEESLAIEIGNFIVIVTKIVC